MNKNLVGQDLAYYPINRGLHTFCYKVPSSRPSSKSFLCLDHFVSNSSTKSSLIVPYFSLHI